MTVMERLIWQDTQVVMVTGMYAYQQAQVLTVHSGVAIAVVKIIIF